MDYRYHHLAQELYLIAAAVGDLDDDAADALSEDLFRLHDTADELRQDIQQAEF